MQLGVHLTDFIMRNPFHKLCDCQIDTNPRTVGIYQKIGSTPPRYGATRFQFVWHILKVFSQFHSLESVLHLATPPPLGKFSTLLFCMEYRMWVRVWALSRPSPNTFRSVLDFGGSGETRCLSCHGTERHTRTSVICFFSESRLCTLLHCVTMTHKDSKEKIIAWGQNHVRYINLSFSSLCNWV